jgi:TRAP-type C4-dicarboxylate transport system permease large subunit
VHLESIFKGIFPFLAAIIAGIALLMLFPGLITWLPGLMY